MKSIKSKVFAHFRQDSTFLTTAILLLAGIAFAADPPAPTPTLTDAQRIDLAQLVHQADQLQIQLTSLNAEFLSLQSKAQGVQAQYAQLAPKANDLQKQIDQKKADLLKATGADPAKFLIDDSLTIKPREAAKPAEGKKP